MRVLRILGVFTCVAALVVALRPSFAQQGSGVVSITLPAPSVEFKSGPGDAKVKANCLVCHGADYVYMQPPLTAMVWKAEVLKMKNVFGAQIDDADVDAIVQYLVAQNGKAN